MSGLKKIRKRRHELVGWPRAYFDWVCMELVEREQAPRISIHFGGFLLLLFCVWLGSYTGIQNLAARLKFS